MRLRLAAAALVLALLVSGGAGAQPKPADDADFLFRMGMLEGHLLVAHELIQAKKQALALPHFGHPVKELYEDISPYLKAHDFPPFDKDLIALEAAATAAPYTAETEAKYQAVIAILHKARALAPAEMRASLPEMIKLCATTVDAASGEYGEAVEKGKVAEITEYHDSRGYLAWVAQQVAALKKEHPDAASQARIDKFTAVLAKAQWIVGELIPAPAPRATVEEYRKIAADARAAASSFSASP